MKLLYITFFISTISYCQTTSLDSSKVTLKEIHSLYLQKNQKKTKEYNDLQIIEKSIKSSPFIKGYHYSFNLDQLEKIIPISKINTFLSTQNKSFFKKSIFKNTNTDIRFKSYVNMNGAAQIITFKGGFFNDYNGNYSLQISYRLSPEDYNINIPKLIKQEVQNGLALKLKIKLENGSK